jgi:hypothetical protein
MRQCDFAPAVDANTRDIVPEIRGIVVLKDGEANVASVADCTLTVAPVLRLCPAMHAAVGNIPVLAIYTDIPLSPVVRHTRDNLLSCAFSAGYPAAALLATAW